MINSSCAVHGTAMRYAAERRNLDESIAELREIADGRNDILAEAAGITAGVLVRLAVHPCRPRIDRRRNVDLGRRRQRQAAGLWRARALDAGLLRAGNEFTQGGAVNIAT